MENAAKALVIAGGVLLAIITVSLFVYMTTATSRMAQAQDEKTALEQLIAFNNEYEAYNKRVMYGTDIITVVNKAIVHNEKMLASKEEDPYYINITITVNEKFETTYEKIDNGTQETAEEPEEISYASIPADVRAKFALKPNNDANSLAAGSHTLGNFQENGSAFVGNRDFISFFELSKNDDTQVKGTDVYKMYSALTNFKRAIFECPADGVVYNNQTGRIEAMTFIQKDID